MKSQFKYVTHFHGDVEGKTYKNVTLSNGLQGMKMRVHSSFDLNKFVEDNNIEEGSKVTATLAIKPGKTEKEQLVLVENLSV